MAEPAAAADAVGFAAAAAEPPTVRPHQMIMKAEEPEYDDAIARCASAAREYCRWIEEAPLEEPAHRYVALSRLASLYASALELPDVPDSVLETSEGESSDVSSALMDRVMERVARFSVRHYWRFDGSTTGTAGESVQDDVARDLYMVYAGVIRHVADLESQSQRRLSAVWSCQYTFWADWGRHAAHAIQAIQDELSHEAWSDE